MCWLSEIRFRLRFRLLAPVVQRTATRRFRDRAWVTGFGWTLARGRKEPFWAGMLAEFGYGNEAAIAVSAPIWSASEQAPSRRPEKPGLLARFLPASRAGVMRLGLQVESDAALIAAAFKAEKLPVPARFGGPPQTAPGVRHLVAIDSSAWDKAGR